jgi:hypothetical protein
MGLASEAVELSGWRSLKGQPLSGCAIAVQPPRFAPHACPADPPPQWCGARAPRGNHLEPLGRHTGATGLPLTAAREQRSRKRSREHGRGPQHSWSSPWTGHGRHAHQAPLGPGSNAELTRAGSFDLMGRPSPGGLTAGTQKQARRRQQERHDFMTHPTKGCGCTEIHRFMWAKKRTLARNRSGKLWTTGRPRESPLAPTGSSTLSQVPLRGCPATP